MSEERADTRTALIACIMSNAFRDTKKQKKPYKIQDFMPQKKRKSRKKAPEQIVSAFQLWNAALGGKERGRVYGRSGGNKKGN